MNKATAAAPRNGWSGILMVVGSIAMLIGAVDPREGAAVILPGSGLVALGAFLGHSERRLIAYTVGALPLIAFGVDVMWVLSWLGGFGGKSQRSMWWGVLVLPYWLAGRWAFGGRSRRAGCCSWALLSVFGMIVTLEKRGFIRRTPGAGRSIQLLLSRDQLPDLK